MVKQLAGEIMIPLRECFAVLENEKELEEHGFLFTMNPSVRAAKACNEMHPLVMLEDQHAEDLFMMICHHCARRCNRLAVMLWSWPGRRHKLIDEDPLVRDVTARLFKSHYDDFRHLQQNRHGSF